MYVLNLFNSPVSSDISISKNSLSFAECYQLILLYAQNDSVQSVNAAEIIIHADCIQFWL
jgi:hypothetical protein